MLKKIQESFKTFTTPKSESAYPWVDRAIGLIPLAVGGVMCFTADSKTYKPSEKIFYKWGPAVVGAYGATQIGLTYAKDFVEKIENPYAKWTGDFVVGLLDTWNNVPIYTYACNMLPGQLKTNFVLAYDYLPNLVETIEGDIKTAVKGGKYESTSWKLNTGFISGAVSRNVAGSYKDTEKDTFDSVVVSALTAAPLKQALSGILRPSQHKPGEINTKIMKGIAENIMYAEQNTIVSHLTSKLPWTESGEYLCESSAFAGVYEGLIVETFFYLLDKLPELIDGGVKVVQVACEDNPELCQQTDFPIIEKVAAPAA